MEASQRRVGRLWWLWAATGVVVGGAWAIAGPYYAIQYAAVAGLVVWAWRWVMAQNGELRQPDYFRSMVGWLAVIGVLVDVFVVKGNNPDFRTFGFVLLGVIAAWSGWKMFKRWANSEASSAPPPAYVPAGGGVPAVVGLPEPPPTNHVMVTEVFGTDGQREGYQAVRVFSPDDYKVFQERQGKEQARVIQVRELYDAGGQLQAWEVVQHMTVTEYKAYRAGRTMAPGGEWWRELGPPSEAG